MGLKDGLIAGGKLSQARDFKIRISEELERKLARNDEENDGEEENEDEDEEDEDDSRLVPTGTGRSTLNDVTNTPSGRVNESSPEIPSSPVLNKSKRPKLKRKTPTNSNQSGSITAQHRD